MQRGRGGVPPDLHGPVDWGQGDAEYKARGTEYFTRNLSRSMGEVACGIISAIRWDWSSCSFADWRKLRLPFLQAATAKVRGALAIIIIISLILCLMPYRF